MKHVMSQFQWYFFRLLAMNPREVHYRIQQLLKIQIEKRFDFPKVANDYFDITKAWDDFHSERAFSFFFSSAEQGDLRKLYKKNFPSGSSLTTSIADKLLNHEIVLFDTELKFCFPVQWHKDLLSNRLWPKKQFWGDIDIRDGRTVGGVKWVWEFNRHHHIVTLAKAFFITRNEKYADAACTHLESWIDQNPRGKGVNWTSSLELGIRIINWSWALAFLRGSATLKQPLFDKINQAVADQANHISRHLSKYSSANNHLIGEAAGLVFAGICFPWLPKANSWRDKGLSIMNKEVPSQIYEDGVPAEQAIQYFAFMLDFNQHVWPLVRLNGIDVPQWWSQRISKASQFIESILTKEGNWIPIGDSDNAWVVRLDESGEQTRLTSYLCTFAIELGKAPPLLDEKAFWLYGKPALNVEPKEPSKATSAIFPIGGYIIMRHEDILLTVDCGPLGYLTTAAHGHADALSMALMVGEIPLLIDPNTYAFQEGYQWRDYFRSTAAHNTVVIDDKDQSEILGVFLWGKKAETHQLYWKTTEAFDLFIGEHLGYKDDDVIHRRAVYFEKPNRIFVFDYLEGKDHHKFEQLWHFPPGTEVSQENYSVHIKTTGLSAVFQFPILREAADIKFTFFEGNIDPIQGWDSPFYGQKLPAPVISISGRSRLPLLLRSKISLNQPESPGNLVEVQLDIKTEESIIALLRKSQEDFVV